MKNPYRDQKSAKPASLSVNVSGGPEIDFAGEHIENITVIGKIETLVKKTINTKELRRLQHEQRIGWGALGVLIIVAAVVSLMIVLNPRAVEHMSGGFNVAVAEFGLTDQRHNVVDPSSTPERGKGLAREVALQLQRELTVTLSTTNTAGNFLVWGPDNGVRSVQGQTDDAREGDALKLLDSIEADVLLYGDLVVEDTQTRFAPVLCLSDRKLPDAEEMQGCYPMGHMQIEDNILRNPMADADLSTMMKQRLLGGTEGMTQFIYGLGSLAQNKLEASVYFTEAISRAAAAGADPAMMRILYLFAAKSWHELAAQQATDKDRMPYWDLAQQHYKQALDASNQEYARAWLGFADIEFQKARKKCKRGETDQAGLEKAIIDYQQALRAKDQTESSNIEAKAAFYLGRAYSCESLAGYSDRWADAMSETLKAKESYSTTMRTKGATVTNMERYSEAIALLGFIYWQQPQSDLHAAALAYQEAIDYTHKNYHKAIYHNHLALIYEDLGDYSQADAHWEQAQQCAPEQSDDYTEQRQEQASRRANAPVFPTATLPPHCQ